MWYKYESVTYGSYVYPISFQIFGWIIALISIVAIPIGAFHSVIKADGDSLMKVSFINI